MADPDIDCILNLTIPAAHAEITLQALNNGKHVYSEKPFVTQLKDGLAILEKAREKSLTVGNAPDTFLGGRWQTCRKLIDEGIIGRPIGVTAFVGTHGVERHHPNPDFYYHKGGGPLLDLGPYYLTAMVFLLGPIVAVNGMGSSAFSQRMIENGPRHGEKIDVEVDTHSQSMLVFENGALGSMTISFDIWDSEMPRFEIYGEEGTILLQILTQFMAQTYLKVMYYSEQKRCHVGHINLVRRIEETGEWQTTSSGIILMRGV